MKIGILLCSIVLFVSAEVHSFGFQVALSRAASVDLVTGFSGASPGFVVQNRDTSVVSDDRPERVDEIRLRIERLRRNMPRGVQVVSGNENEARESSGEREDELLRILSRLEYLITQLEIHQATQTQTATGVRTEAERVYVRDTVRVYVRDTVYVDREVPSLAEIRTIEVELFDKGIFRTSSVMFEFDRTRILPASYPILNEIGRILGERGDVRIEVQGHTDSFGTRAYNLNLSEMRAEAVRGYLLERFPEIDEDRIVARGLGPDEPIAENTSTTGRALNRRVDFVVLEVD